MTMRNQIFALIMTLLCAAAANADSYQISGERRFTVVVNIRPGSHFESTTDKFSGVVIWQGKPLKGKITVRLDTLQSGIGVRDSHMREKTIHSAQYPEAVFEPQSFTGLTDLAVGEARQFIVTGNLTFHGRTRQVTADARAALQKDGSIQVDARLKLHLPDFGVEPPSLAFVQVGQQVVVLLRFTLKK